MNNIENSIRHLQSSIDKRSEEIKDTQGDVAFTLELAKCTTKNCTIVEYIKNDWRAHYMWKRHLEYLTTQQKVEKKMLAMMLSLNRMQYSKNTTVKSTCEYLDNL